MITVFSTMLLMINKRYAVEASILVRGGVSEMSVMKRPF